MWVARIQFDGKNAVIGKRCRKFSVSISGYPVSIHFKEDGLYLYAVYFVFGDEKNVAAFIKDLRAEERVLHVEHNGNFIICQIKEPLKHSCAYKHNIIHLEPLQIMEDGTEFWTLGSWNKEDLMVFLDLVEGSYGGKLLSVRERDITNFSIVSMNAALTDNQRRAIEIAIQKGYYDYPRNVDLKELARCSSISYATYHAHLRKAEQKLLPFLLSRLRHD